MPRQRQRQRRRRRGQHGGRRRGGTEAAAGGRRRGRRREVEIFGAFADAEADLFDESLQPFIDETGIDVEYNGVPDFDTEITTRVEGGDLPDIALFPQPGLLLDIAEQTDAIAGRASTSTSPRSRRA